MNIRSLAESDLAVTIGDAAAGFGQPVTVTNPSGDSLQVIAQTGDATMIQTPDTGEPFVARKAHAAIRISDLQDLGMPEAIQDPDRKPWTVLVTGLDGTQILTRIVEALPDRTLGLVLCILERYSQVPA